MAKKPHEVFSDQSIIEPELSQETVFAIVSSIEEVTDLALGEARPGDFCSDGSFELVLRVENLKTTPITRAVKMEFIRRYMKSPQNPDGWTNVTIEVNGNRILIKLYR